MIYLVRHGQTDWNIEKRIQGLLDLPLNTVGRKEAEVCAEEAMNLKLDRIIASDMLRARETAQIINSRLNLPIVFDARLREINFGDLQGRCTKDISSEDWDIFNRRPADFHAEALTDVFARMKAVLNEQDKVKNTLIVSHGGAIRMAVYMAYHPNAFNLTEFEQNFLQFKIKNTEIIKWDKSYLKIE